MSVSFRFTLEMFVLAVIEESFSQFPHARTIQGWMYVHGSDRPCFMRMCFALQHVLIHSAVLPLWLTAGSQKRFRASFFAEAFLRVLFPLAL